MASLVSAAEATVLEAALGDHFDTFKATITVNKEPQKTVTLSASQNIYAGYSAPKEQVTYTPVSATFSAIVNYKENQPLDYQDELKANIEKGDVRIKVELECRDYIEKGKTLSIDIGGNPFNVVSSEGVRYFLGKNLLRILFGGNHLMAVRGKITIDQVTKKAFSNSKVFQNLAYGAVKKKADALKKKTMAEFDKHEVTKELERGTSGRNSLLLGGRGNFFGFLGF